MSAPFSGQRIVVTGGASGIGRACCELLAERGAAVVVVDVNAEGARATAEAIGGEARQLDVGDVATIEACAAEIEQSLGPVDGLVNCAGLLQPDAAPPERLPFAIGDRLFEVNLRGTQAVCFAFGLRMAARRGSCSRPCCTRPPT